MQSMLVFGTACVAFVVCLSIPFLGWILSIFVFYGSAALWLILMFKAYQGERFKLPLAGDIAEKRISITDCELPVPRPAIPRIANREPRTAGTIHV